MCAVKAADAEVDDSGTDARAVIGRNGYPLRKGGKSRSG
jgi:hypothetical protein